jgi:5'(3')-deoxyribonucleotidase
VRPLVLLDTDGVLGGFVEAALAAAHTISSKRWAVEDLSGWDFWKSMADPEVPDLEARIMERISAEGFCSSIPVLAGAVEGVESLRSVADIVVVTTPWRSRTWAHERFEWLERNFGFTRDSVIQTSNKADVDGDILVDDSFTNLRRWENRRMYRGSSPIIPVLWETHFNRDLGDSGWSVARSWDDVILAVREFEGLATYP